MCRDLAGTDSAEMEFNGDTDRAAFLSRLLREFPKISDIKPQVGIAVNNEYAVGEFTLKDGDEIGLIPPVSGG